eukprot:13042776-Alexandrium_andersonii.AAC.1
MSSCASKSLWAPKPKRAPSSKPLADGGASYREKPGQEGNGAKLADFVPANIREGAAKKPRLNDGVPANGPAAVAHEVGKLGLQTQPVRQGKERQQA